jgi:hypothetical protein
MNKTRLRMSVASTLLSVSALIVGVGLLTACQGGSGQSGIGDGPGMLFFFAEW